jgi:hypothetical protein
VRWGVEVLESRALLSLGFDYAMAERFGRDLNNNGRIDLPNTATYAQPQTLALTFSVLDGADRRWRPGDGQRPRCHV